MPTVSEGATGVVKEEITTDSKVIVHFRPHEKYRGEYGFDWIRIGNNNNKEIENDKIYSYLNRYYVNNTSCKSLLGKYINAGCEKKWDCEKMAECIDLNQNPNKKCLNSNFLIQRVSGPPKILKNTFCKELLPDKKCNRATDNNCFNENYNEQQVCIDFSKYITFADNVNSFCKPCGAVCFSENYNPQKVCQDINGWSSVFQKDEESDGEMLRGLQHHFDREICFGFGCYRVPVLTILPDEKIKLRIRVYIEKNKQKPKELQWKYESEIFTVDKHGIDLETTDSWQEKEFTLTCEKEFSEDKFLEVFYYDKYKSEVICGKLQILANDNRHRKELNVVMVNVKVRIGNEEATEGVFKGTTELEKILKQGYAHIKDDKGKHISELLDLTDSDDARKFRAYVDNSSSVRKIKGDGDLLDFLNSKLDSKLDGKYKDYYKIYSINEFCIGYVGFAVSGTKSCVVFKEHTEEDITHEFLHVLKLPHTFTAKEIVEDPAVARKIKTYKAKETDNIMDYSHKESIKKISTFYWQWKIINPNIS